MHLMSVAGTELKNETLMSKIRPYRALSEEQHKKLHDNKPDEEIAHPHSLVSRVIHEDIGDDDSPVVAIMSGFVAWDASLRNLLPEGVGGVIAVVANNCNQTFTYEIDGPNAYFLGFGDSHDPAYESSAVEVDLAPHTNPAFPTTPGHCMYTMVRNRLCFVFEYGL